MSSVDGTAIFGIIFVIIKNDHARIASNSFTASQISSIASFTSSVVLNLPSPILIASWDWSSFNPIANRTWDGSTSSVVHAEPAEIAIFLETELIIALLSIPSNLTFRLCVRRFVGWPFSFPPTFSNSKKYLSNLIYYYLFPL